MKIRMAGIDYTKAKLSQREIFAFSAAQSQDAMKRMAADYLVDSCVIISTCNRTEIWVCEDDDSHTDLIPALCSLKKVNPFEHKNLMTAREGIDSVRHLFETACGLNSQIWGEDQILTQIKSSIESARSAKTTNEIMEKLFQTAITSAKRIKSTVKLTPYDPSLAVKVLETAKIYFPNITELKCLVIGNGEIGRSISSTLAKYGVQVTVTLRKYKKKISPVPEGCQAVLFEERLEAVRDADLIISATSSPHYTIKYSDLSKALSADKNRLFIDLAVPRDIDPQITELSSSILLDIESMGGLKQTEDSNKSLGAAKKIIEEYMIDFIKWSQVREFLPLLNSTIVISSEVLDHKLCHKIEQSGLRGQMGDPFEKKVISVVREALNKMVANRSLQYNSES